MQIWELENFCWDTDGIRVVIRAPASSPVKGFPRTNAVNQRQTISWYREKIKALVGDNEFIIINGSGSPPHGLTKIENVRDSYSQVPV